MTLSAPSLPTKESAQTELSPLSNSEVAAWVLVSILTVLLTGLLTVNFTVLWVYKKRQARDTHTDGQVSKYTYEMEDNPCYEASVVKQTTDAGTHVYETVRVGGAR